MEWLFGMSVSWEVRREFEEWEPKMHIDKEVRTLKTFFNNLPFSPQIRFCFHSTTSKKLKFFFFFFFLILLRAWNLKQWGLRWPKAPQQWQTMSLCPQGLLGRDLATWFCSFFNKEHWGLMWPITKQWWQVETNLDPSKTLG